MFFKPYDSFRKNAGESWSYSESNGIMRFEVRDGDYYNAPPNADPFNDVALDRNRSEVGSMRALTNERLFTLEFDFLVESGAQNNAAWLSLVQFQRTEDRNADGDPVEVTLGPPLSIGMRGEYLTVSGRTDPNAVTTGLPPAISLNGHNELMYQSSTPLTRDAWHSVKLEVIFDSDPNGKGMLKITIDGQVVVDYQGPIGYNDLVGPYLQLGVYRAATTETMAAQYRDVTMVADGLPPPMEGTNGNDTITANNLGFWEDEILRGFAGDDILDGGWGDDTMYGGTGNDYYVVDRVGDVVSEAGGGGIDLVRSYVSYTLPDDVENIILWDTANINATGNAMDNRINGNRGDNLLRGLGGKDTIIGDAGNDTVEGGDGEDQLFGGTGADSVSGGADADRLFGEDGDDTLDGGSGNDTLEGGAGTDRLIGGPGDDQYVIESAGDTAIEKANEGTDTVRAAVSYDPGATNHIEVINTTDQSGTAPIDLWGTDGANVIRGNDGVNTLTGRGGNDEIYGAGGADQIDGDSGNDRLYGDDGNDTLRGGIGDDQLQGGNGRDSLEGAGGRDSLYGGNDADTLDGGADADQLYGNNGADSLLGGDGADSLYGGDDNDTLRGGANDDQLRGEGGDDWLYGDTGDDVFFGGSGNDTMTGGSGDDTYLVEDTGDVVVEALGGGNDTVRTSVSFDAGAANHVETINAADRLSTVRLDIGGTDQANTIRGSAGANTLLGRGGNDVMFGYEGDDTMDGGAGDDALYAGTGKDVLSGGSGNDTYHVDGAGTVVNEAAGAGFDTVRTTVSVVLPDASEVEVVRVSNQTTTNQVNLTGSRYDNDLRGNDGANVLNGKGGADRMFGYGGDDSYHVDDAGDRFYEDAGGGVDTVFTSVNVNLNNTQYIEVVRSVGTDVRLDGNDFDNQLFGDAGDNWLVGNGGNDRLRGGLGDDTIYGGTGTDTVVIGVASTDAWVSVGGTTMVLHSLEGSDFIVNDVEFFEFTDRTLTYAEATQLPTSRPPSVGGTPTEGPDRLVGDDGGNNIVALGGDDTILGMGSNDWITPGAGSDDVDGGDGVDMVSFVDLGQAVIVDLSAGTA
ncbi:hypothetical protein DXV76_21040, partial [Rhodobacteraceae bacterium CCMM004]